MRGIIFSAMGVAVLTTLAMIAVFTLEHAKNTIPTNKTLLGGRIKAAYYHIAWEYWNRPESPESVAIDRGCAPVIILDTMNDPIHVLAKPYVFYACGD